MARSDKELTDREIVEVVCDVATKLKVKVSLMYTLTLPDDKIALLMDTMPELRAVVRAQYLKTVGYENDQDEEA